MYKYMAIWGWRGFEQDLLQECEILGAKLGWCNKATKLIKIFWAQTFLLRKRSTQRLNMFIETLVFGSS